MITSWSHVTTGSVGQLKLKVLRRAGGDSFTVIGESALQTPVPSALNTFATRIPVARGDLIGAWFFGPEQCAIGRPSGYGDHALPSDQLPGTTSEYDGPGGFQIDIAATLEPDADCDGFGDETQDPSIDQFGCATPDTKITSKPKDKTRRHLAKFEFSSSIAGATFECSLDGGAFAPCTSPHSVEVKTGKHSFSVRAVSKGQTDTSAATDDWRVKKKRRE